MVFASFPEWDRAAGVFEPGALPSSPLGNVRSTSPDCGIELQPDDPPPWFEWFRRERRSMHSVAEILLACSSYFEVWEEAWAVRFDLSGLLTRGYSRRQRSKGLDVN